MNDFNKQVNDMDKYIESMKNDGYNRMINSTIEKVLKDNIPESYDDIKIQAHRLVHV